MKVLAHMNTARWNSMSTADREEATQCPCQGGMQNVEHVVSECDYMVTYLDEMVDTVDSALRSESEAVQVKWMAARNMDEKVAAVVGTDMRRVSPDTTGAAMDSAGAEAAATGLEDLSTAELASQGRLICAAATAALKETVDAGDFEDEQYSPETPSGTYSPVTLSYSSDAAMPVQQDQYVRAAAVDTTEAAMVAVSAGLTAADAAKDAAREDAAAGGAEERDAAAMRGRTGARVCTSGCRARLAALVQAADRLPAGHRRRDGCRVTD